MGWYFQNLSDKHTVTKLAGYYELISPGEVGNLGRVIANVPAAEAILP